MDNHDSRTDIQPAIITNNVKLLMTFIDRVGFPVMAFLLMWWQNHLMAQTLERLHETMTANVEIMRQVNDAIKDIKRGKIRD